MELIETILMWAGAIVSACTLICAGLDKIAGITPSTRDDEYVGKAKHYLGIAAAILDKFSVHQTKP